MFNSRYFFVYLRILLRKASRFFTDSRSKEFLTFAFFVLLSSVFWMLQSMNEDAEVNFNIPVKFVNIPENIVLTNALPSKVEMKLRDKGVILFNYSINKRFYPLEVDFNQYKNTKGIILIKPKQILLSLKKQLKSTTEILSLNPDSLKVYYSQQQGKRVPIKVSGNFFANYQSVISGDITTIPTMVTVYAPAEILSKIHYAVTDSTILTGLTDTVKTKIQLRNIHGAKFVPPEVEVIVPVEEYTEKKFDLAVKGINVPENIILKTFPSNIKLTCFVALSRFTKLDRSMFQLGVNFDSISGNSSRIAVEILRSPSFVTNIKIVPDSLEYLLELR